MKSHAISARLQDAASYEEIIDRLEQAESKLELMRFIDAIHEGESAIAEGRIRPAGEVFAEIRAKHRF